MNVTILAGGAALLVGLAATVAPAAARDQIRLVGSSTVFPIAAQVAEQFGKQSGKTPIVESTGTGAGIKLFCAGIGEQTPDIANASRRILPAEIAACGKNGVSITEAKVGYDGIALVSGVNAAPLKLSRGQLWLAMAKDVPVGGKLIANPYRKWSEIDPALPNAEIVIYGPAANHGTRDAVIELIMDAGCEQNAAMKALPAGQMRKACTSIREDGVWIDVADAYNVTVERVLKTPQAIGIIGFGFFDANRGKLRAMPVEGVEPSFDAIASGKYPVSRPLYFYIKREHAAVIPGLKAFVAEFVSKKAIGPEGYTIDRGLIPLPVAQFERTAKDAAELAKLTDLESKF